MKRLTLLILGGLLCHLAFAADPPTKADWPRLLKETTAKDAKVRLAACEGIATVWSQTGLGGEDAIEPLILVLKKDPDTKVRAAAAIALRPIKGAAKRATPVLMDLLKTEKNPDSLIAYLNCFCRFAKDGQEALTQLQEFADKTQAESVAAQKELASAKESGDKEKIRLAEEKRNTCAYVAAVAKKAYTAVRALDE